MTITLISGQEVDSNRVQFDAQAQRFYLTSGNSDAVEDITEQLRQDDRITLGGPGYDVNGELIRRSEGRQNKKAPSEESTSTSGQFWRNLDDEVETVMEGVGETAANAASAAKKAASKTLDAAPKILNPLAVIAVVVALLYFARKI
jgi:hypothetical protein